MAPPKKETTADLCNRVTAQGNTISIRMLEYLSTAKNPVHGFEPLANEFLELARLLWSIEAGLNDASNKRNAFPADITQELDKRFKLISDEFIVLSQMVNKFVDNESSKGGFGKRFRMMFADTDVDKMRTTLSRSRDALKVSSAMFRWTLGDAKADAAMSIGYTGLAAALERMNPTKASVLPPPQPPPTSDPPRPPSKRAVTNPPDPPPVQPSPLVERHMLSDVHPQIPDRRPSLHEMHHRSDDHVLPPNLADLQRNWRAPSIRSDGTTHSVRDTVYQRNFDELSSDDSGKSRTLIEEQLNDLDLNERYVNDRAFQSKVDSMLASPVTPSWSTRQSAGSKAAGGKAALVNAVQLKNHQMLEQLLHAGARADPRVEAAMLRAAIQTRDFESVALLLRYGADANGSDKDGYTPLFTATQVASMDCAKVLLKHGADANMSAGPEEESPLSLAASDNQIDLVQLYLNHGGDANHIVGNGSTALVQAMNKTTSPKIAELLLSSGGDPNGKNGEGTTALLQAIMANRVDLMTYLLDHGANPNLPGPKHPLWPATYKPKCLELLLSRGADHKKAPGLMELAASLKKLESIQILMGAGVSPNVRKDGVYTPLCSAIRDNSADIVTYLLEHGADPNMNASEYPAFKCITHQRTHFLPQLVAAGVDLNKPKGILETAVAHDDKSALIYLLDNSVPPNDRNPDGHTALTTAIRENRGEMVDLLLSRGADPAVRGEDWPLCMAVKQPAILKKLLAATPNPRAFRGVVEMAVVANQLDSIKLLLAAGVSVEDKNCGVFSPLTTAIREERKDIVRYLLDEAGADPNAPGEHLPIVKALRRYSGDPEIIQMLLTRGADINKMHRGWNAILQAVENGDAKILRLLIDMGGSVDLQQPDESGRPVVDIVTERGWEEGLALLFPNADGKANARQ